MAFVSGGRLRAALFLGASLGLAWLPTLPPSTGAEPGPAPPARPDSTPRPIDLIHAARRIVVLGDSITNAGGWVGLLQAWMESRGMEADVIDVGLSSETVSGLSEEGHADGKFPRPDLGERLERVLRVTRPDLVLACYGMNCGIYLPRDDSRFAAFRDGMERLHAAVERAGARIIHLTPPVYDARPDRPGPAKGVDYDAVLAGYSDWLLSRRADGWIVIDVHGPMRRLLDEARQSDPSVVFAPDAVHPNDLGNWAFCRAVLSGLGDEDATAAAEATTPEAFSALLPEVMQRLRILRDAYLSAAGHLRPGVAEGLPLGEAERRAARFTESIRSRRHQLFGVKHSSGEWRIPLEWPRPRVVDPGPAPSSPAPIPSDAIRLFDGTSLDAWEDAESWTVADGVATVGRKPIRSKQAFGDCQLHVEFRTPAPAAGSGQGRGNSGVFLMGLYEIQVLDSFEDGTDGPLTYPDGQCGALYKQQPPAVNACRGPGEWQSFDILFTRPRFAADGALERPARLSVTQNGVTIHLDTVVKGPTAWHMPPRYARHPDALPIMLQDHGNPVQFRSIWVRPFEAVEPRPVPRETISAR
jgi:lysophospholipase L1-like esterase